MKWDHGFILGTEVGSNEAMISYLSSSLLWPHEVGPWFHSWYRSIGSNEAMISYLSSSLVWPHEVGPWFHSWYRSRQQ